MRPTMFEKQVMTALSLLPEESQESFMFALCGCLAHCVGANRQRQCLEAALFMVQDFKPEHGLRLVKK